MSIFYANLNGFMSAKNHNKKEKNEFLSDNLQFLYMLKWSVLRLSYIQWILVDDFLVEKYFDKKLNEDLCVILARIFQL